jgi:hypothetical protein
MEEYVTPITSLERRIDKLDKQLTALRQQVKSFFEARDAWKNEENCNDAHCDVISEEGGINCGESNPDECWMFRRERQAEQALRKAVEA